MEFEFLQSISPLLVFVISYILIYLAIKKFELPGNNTTHAVLSLLVSILILSYTSSTEFLAKSINYLSVILIISFFFLLLLSFITKDISSFTKPLLWVSFTLGILIIIAISFDSFPQFLHMFPSTSNTHLSISAREVKKLIYSEKFYTNFLFIAFAIITSYIVMKK